MAEELLQDGNQLAVNDVQAAGPGDLLDEIVKRNRKPASPSVVTPQISAEEVGSILNGPPKKKVPTTGSANGSPLSQDGGVTSPAFQPSTDLSGQSLLNNLTGSQQMAPVTDPHLRAINTHYKTKAQMAADQAAQPKPQVPGRNIADDITNALYIPAFNQGFNDLVIKPASGAVDFLDRTIDKAYKGITGEDTPQWLRKGGAFHDFSKKVDGWYENRDKPTNIVSETAEGLVGQVPLIAGLFTGATEASLAAKTPQLFGKLSKVLATTKGLTGFKDATERGEDLTSSLGSSAKEAMKGGLEGGFMEAQMLVGGALGKGVANKLAEKGLLKGGKAAEAVLHALSVGTVFGGTSAGEDLLQGKEIDTHEALKQFATGLAFEIIPTGQGIDAELKTRKAGRKINDNVLQDAAMAASASNMNAESAIRTLINTPIDQLKAVQENIKPGYEDLYADSIEQGAKAYEAKDNNEKRDLYTNQLVLKTQGDIKFLSDRLKTDREEVLNTIRDNTELSQQEKADLVDKMTVLDNGADFYKEAEASQEPVTAPVENATAPVEQVPAQAEIVPETPPMEATAPMEVPAPEPQPINPQINDLQPEINEADTPVLPDQPKETTPTVPDEASANPVDFFKLGEQDEFYHASPTKRDGRLKSGWAPQFGEGVYFSTNKDLVIDEFGKELTSVKLNVKKPLYTSTKEESAVKDKAAENWNKENLTWDEDNEWYTDKNGRETMPVEGEELGERLPVKYYSDAAKELGYDVIIDKDSSTYDNEIVVLHPEKISYDEDRAAKVASAEVKPDAEPKEVVADKPTEPETVKTAPLEVNEDLKKAGIGLRAVQMKNGKYGIFQETDGKVSGKSLGRSFDTAEELTKAYEGGIKEKLTAEAINKATRMQDETKPVTNREVANDIAKKIRSKKVANDLNSFALGVGKAVWNGALETAATTVEAGGSIADAIQSAVRHIKGLTDHKNDREIYYAIRKELQDTGFIERSDIDYSKELVDASLTQKQLATKGKKDELYRELSEINPATLTSEEIVQYNNLMNDSKANRDELAKFSDEVKQRQDDEAADREREWYKQIKDDEEFADDNLKKILKETAKTTEESPDLESTKDNNTAKKALKKLLGFGRKELERAETPDNVKEVRDAILKLDESKLSTKELRDLNKSIEAMIYDQNYAGSGKWLAMDKAINRSSELLTDIKARGFDKGQTSKLAGQLRSLDQNAEVITKSSKGASVLQEKAGIQDISAGNARVNKVMTDVSKAFTKIVDRMGRGTQSTENRYKRGVLALFTQQADVDSPQEHFDRYKDYVATTARRLLKSTDKTEQREGKLVQDIFDNHVKDATSSEEVINNLTKDNANNAKLVSFFIDQYKNVYPDLRHNTLLYSGKDLPSIANYTATSMKLLRGNEPTSDIDFSITDPVSLGGEDIKTNTDQARTTISRKKSMANNRVLNLNFDGLQMNRLRESHYDAQTLASRYLYDAIRKQPDFKEALGGKTNVNVISEGVATMVKAQRGFNQTDPIAKSVLELTSRLAASGTRLALKGIDQVVKQYPSVAINTLGNLGADAGLYFKAIARVSPSNPIFNESGIGLRGLQKGGTNFEANMQRLQKFDFRTGNEYMAAISKALDKADDILGYALSKSDDMVAKHSWAAYYMQDLKNRGVDIDRIDWTTEHSKVDREAAAYAEQMVSRNQIPNDPTKSAVAYQKGDIKGAKDLGVELAKNIALPFTSFARNTQSRIANDIRKFYGGDRKEAAISLASTVMEAGVFNAIKLGLLYGTTAAASSILTNYGYTPPLPVDVEEKLKDIPSQAVDDMLLAGTGSIADALIKNGINNTYQMVSGKQDGYIFKNYDPAKFGETNFGLAGMYGIFPQQIYTTVKAGDYSDGEIEGYADQYSKIKGFYKQKYVSTLTDKQKELAQAIFVLDITSLLGLQGATTNRIKEQVFREIKKQKAPVKFSSGMHHNSKSGSLKAEE